MTTPSSENQRTFIVTENVNEKKFSDSYHSMTMDNYQKTFFVLNSLFEGEYLEKIKKKLNKF